MEKAFIGTVSQLRYLERGSGRTDSAKSGLSKLEVHLFSQRGNCEQPILASLEGCFYNLIVSKARK